MIYTLIIRSHHLQNTYNAINFAQALLSQQHTINYIYFLFDGAYTANINIDMPTDEPNLSQQWSELAQNNNLILHVCASSALRRGINVNNLASSFAMGSIGQLVESADQADRVVSL